MKSGVEVLRSLEELEAIGEDWQRLQVHPNADFDFYRVAVRSNPAVIRPHVLVLWSEGRVAAILAGRLEYSPLQLRLGYYDLPSPSWPALIFVHGGMMGDGVPAVCEPFLRSILEALGRGEAARALFNHLKTDSPLFAAVRGVPPLLLRDPCPSMQVHRRMQLPNSPDAFQRRFSRKTRHNIHREATALLNSCHGDLRIRCLGTPDTFDVMMHDVEMIAAKTYQRSLSGGFCDTAQERQRLELKSRHGWLRCHILYLESQPCAFWMGTVYGGTFYSDYMGYDPSYRRYSPGKYLMMRVIEDLCAQPESRPVCAIDFGLGDAEYKRMLGDESWIDSSTSLFAPSLRGLALSLYRTPLVLVDKMARRLVGQQFESRLKRWWRRSFAPQSPAPGGACEP